MKCVSMCMKRPLHAHGHTFDSGRVVPHGEKPHHGNALLVRLDEKHRPLSVQHLRVIGRALCAIDISGFAARALVVYTSSSCTMWYSI